MEMTRWVAFSAERGKPRAALEEIQQQDWAGGWSEYRELRGRKVGRKVGFIL